MHTGIHGHTQTKKNVIVVSTYLPTGRDKGNGEIRKREKITETRPHGEGWSTIKTSLDIVHLSICEGNTIALTRDGKVFRLTLSSSATPGKRTQIALFDYQDFGDSAYKPSGNRRASFPVKILVYPINTMPRKLTKKRFK